VFLELLDRGSLAELRERYVLGQFGFHSVLLENVRGTRLPNGIVIPLDS
jgi:hypothetical protein